MINLEVLQGNEAAIERALELFDNHTRRIRMQREAMDIRRNEIRHTILSTELKETLSKNDPQTVKLTMPNGTEIGTAVVHFEDGIFHVDTLTMSGEAAVVFGIDLSLMSFSPNPLGPLHDKASYVVARMEDEETTDLTNMENEH